MKRQTKTPAEKQAKAERRAASRARREANLALRDKAEAQAKADGMYWDGSIPAARFAEDYDAAYASATAMGKKPPEVLAREAAEAAKAAANDNKELLPDQATPPKKGMIAEAVEAAKAEAAAAKLPEPTKSAEESAAVFAAAEEKPKKGKKHNAKAVQNVDAIKVFAEFVAAVLAAATKEYQERMAADAAEDIHVDDDLVDAGSFEELKRREEAEKGTEVPVETGTTETTPETTQIDEPSSQQDDATTSTSVTNGNALSQQPKQQKLNRKERRRLAAEAKKAADAAKITKPAENSSDVTPSEANPSDHNDEGTVIPTTIPEGQHEPVETPQPDEQRVAADANDLKKIPWHKRTAYDNKPESNVEEVKLLTDQRVPKEPKRPTQEEIKAAETVVEAPSRPTLTLVKDNTSEEAKAFYGAFYTPVRASLLDGAYKSLRLAIIAEGNKSPNMERALQLAIKKEAQAFALSDGMKKAA